MNKKLTNGQLRKILISYRRGKSLKKLSRELKLPKTTIYHHIRKKFGLKILKVQFNPKLQRELGEFMGAFAGDGSFYFRKKNYHYVIRFFLAGYEKQYANKLARIIFLLFKKKPYFHIRQQDNTITVIILSKEISRIIRDYLDWGDKKTYTVRLKNNPPKYKKEFLKGFVSGFIGTDGNIYVPKNRVSVGSTSPQIINQLSQIFDLFKVPHTINKRPARSSRKEFYTLYLNGIDKVKKFNKHFGILNPYKRKQIQQILRKRR